MPAVNKGESRDDYMKRCVPHVMKNEGLGQNAAVGKCEGMFTQHQKLHAAESGFSPWSKLVPSARGGSPSTPQAKQKTEMPRVGPV